MPAEYNAIVIGGGHNGLTCACYLARAGLKVFVLEQYHTVGGMTVTEEITLPGFRSDLHAFGYQFGNLSPAPAELGLANFGFELLYPDPNFLRRSPMAAWCRCIGTSRRPWPASAATPLRTPQPGAGCSRIF